MKKIIFAAILVIAGCSSCKVSSGWISDDENITGGTVTPAEPIALTKAETAMTADANALGFKMFAELEKEATSKLQNRFISPLSLSLALSLCATGAEGTTQSQMLSVLGFDGYTYKQMGEYYKKMVDALCKIDPKTTFTVANAIWASNTISVLNSYVTDAKNYYNSEVHVDDFSAPSTLQNINSWCSKNTNGKIPAILDQLSNELKMVLLNALYFNGKWANRFPDAVTDKFTCANGKTTNVKMMGDTREMGYFEDSSVQVGELRYGNGAFAMDIILPKNGVSISNVIGSLDSEKWDGWMSSLSTREVIFRMPVFKMETTSEMSDALKALGMPKAFSPSADFSAMSTTPLCISFVKQKTYVDVNEKGTEAAAVTAIGMKVTSVGPSEMIIMSADRPFIFAIRERSTGAVLFLGWKTA